VLRGPVEVVLLAQDVREADVLVAGGREHGPGVSLGLRQRALLGRLRQAGGCAELGGRMGGKARLGGVQPRFHSVEVALGQAAPSPGHGQERPAAHHISGQRNDPVAQRAVVMPAAKLSHAQLDQVGGALGVAAGHRVPDRVSERSLAGEPPAGCGVEPGDAVGMTSHQPGTQRIREQVLVAIPPRSSSSATTNRFSRSSGSRVA